MVASTTETAVTCTLRKVLCIMESMYPRMSGKAPRIELATVIAVMGLGVLAISMLGPVLPLYLSSIDVSPDVLGLMFSIAMVGMVFGESSWGWVADRVGL